MARVGLAGGGRAPIQGRYALHSTLPAKAEAPRQAGQRAGTDMGLGALGSCCGRLAIQAPRGSALALHTLSQGEQGQPRLSAGDLGAPNTRCCLRQSRLCRGLVGGGASAPTPASGEAISPLGALTELLSGGRQPLEEDL